VSPEIACIVGLVVLFVVGTALPVNMGALAFVMAFVVGGLYVDMSAANVLAGFPGDLFVTLVGITYLFAIAQNNGTIDWLVRQAVRSVHGHTAAIPWVMFFVTALLTSVGAVSPGAVAIVAPIALRFSQQYRIHPLLMGLMVIHGAQGGGFSPMSIYGGITNQVVQRADLAGNDMHLFFASLGFNLLIAVVVFFVFGGRGLLTRQAVEVAPTEEGSKGLSYPQVLTLLGLIALGVGVLVFELNVGLVAITIAVMLTILFPKDQARAVDQIHWSTVLLICGVVTYIAVLQKGGAVTYVGDSVSSIGAPLVGALLLCYVGRRAGRDHSVGCSLAVARTDRCRECRRRAGDFVLRRRCESLLHQRRTGHRERTRHRPGIVVSPALTLQRDRGSARPAAGVGSTRVAWVLETQRRVQRPMEMHDRAFVAAEDEALVRVAGNATLNCADHGAIFARADLGEGRVTRRGFEGFGRIAAAVRH
jgi:Na+/H+ antiporter NhaD/arsenite permease-like protein